MQKPVDFTLRLLRKPACAAAPSLQVRETGHGKNNLPNAPFALSLSKGRSWFDKLSCRIRSATPANGEVIFDLILVLK